MTHAKKILFLADINSVHTERWVRSTLKRGYSIALFSLSEKTTSWADDLKDLEYFCYGVSATQVASKRRFAKLSYFSAQTEAKNFAKSVQAEIVHAHYASSYGTLARKINHENTVLSLWGSDVYEFPKRSPFHRILFKKALRFPKVVCSTSKDMAREAKQYVNREIVITPFGVDTEFFKPSSQVENDLCVIGTVKALEQVYGIDRLIKLYARLLEKTKMKSRLSIFGEGSQKEELMALTRALGIEKHVVFHGRVDGEQLLEAFQSLDVFVALSRRESFGVAALEAQACGVPVLVSNAGGLPEVASPKTGIVVDQNTPETWLESLLELIKLRGDKASSIQTRDFVLTNFSNEVCVDKLIEVYQNLE
jgi:glycosyltransferase involved in cell wall biosynthesis